MTTGPSQNSSQAPFADPTGCLQKYLDHADRVVYRKGQIIISQGQRALKGVYWLESGRVKLALLTEEGSERIIGFAGGGDSFGEASVLDRDGHLVMAQAMTDCVIHFFERAVVLRLMHDDPALAVGLLWNLSRKLRFVVALVEEMSFCGVKERVAHAIARLAGAENAPEAGAEAPVLRFSHQELAGLVGASRVMVTNALAELKKEGAVDVRRRCLVVRDMRRLTDPQRSRTVV